MASAAADGREGSATPMSTDCGYCVRMARALRIAYWQVFRKRLVSKERCRMSTSV
jgi:bacterioferritin-associated ferredoxin